MKLKGSKTEINILTAFAGESQARNRYTFYASKAKKDGFVQISKIFEETAGQEKEHAERLFKFLEGGEVEIKASFPAGVISTTADNLLEASTGEDYEWQTMYPTFAKVAREEGFVDVAIAMEHILVAEKEHSRRYKSLRENILAGRVFKSTVPVIWRCLNCGYIMEGLDAPEKCPACAHSRDYFELLCENW